LYIDWNGNVMPCVFVPYSAGNIREIYARGDTLEDIYDAPYFRAIREWQWEHALGKEKPEECGNWLVPCSLRDHYDMGRNLIEEYRPEPEDEAAAHGLSVTYRSLHPSGASVADGYFFSFDDDGHLQPTF